MNKQYASYGTTLTLTHNRNDDTRTEKEKVKMNAAIRLIMLPYPQQESLHPRLRWLAHLPRLRPYRISWTCD